MLDMTTLPDDTRMRHAARRLIVWAAWRAVARTASRIAAWHRQRRRIARTVHALSRLSDHALKDIGIRRSEIASIARSGRDMLYDRL
jgi:uncharacterized protein YjiS (DUF1127 family)